METLRVKAVLSDAGGILFDDTHAGKVTYPAVAKMLGMSVDELRTKYRPFKNRTQVDPDYVAKMAWTDFLTAEGRSQEEINQVFALYKKHYAIHELFPGVVETIAGLSQQCIDFIILTDSAGPAKMMHSRLTKELGLTEGLTGVLSSKDLGVMKPDPAFFEAALKKYGLKKEEVVFIAHDYDELRGAHDLGYNVLSLNLKEDEDDFSFIPAERKMEYFSDVLKKVKPV